MNMVAGLLERAVSEASVSIEVSLGFVHIVVSVLLAIIEIVALVLVGLAAVFGGT